MKYKFIFTLIKYDKATYFKSRRVEKLGYFCKIKIRNSLRFRVNSDPCIDPFDICFASGIIMNVCFQLCCRRGP